MINMQSKTLTELAKVALRRLLRYREGMVGAYPYWQARIDRCRELLTLAKYAENVQVSATDLEVIGA